MCNDVIYYDNCWNESSVELMLFTTIVRNNAAHCVEGNLQIREELI